MGHGLMVKVLVSQGRDIPIAEVIRKSFQATIICNTNWRYKVLQTKHIVDKGNHCRLDLLEKITLDRKRVVWKFC